MCRLGNLLIGVTLLATSATSLAATFVVTSADDANDGACTAPHCSLREAITAANATAAADTINFAIQLPIRGTILIQPTSPLPTITQPVTIDGYSQGGTRENDDPVASNANLRVRLDGSIAGATANGLSVCGSEVAIRGLWISGFASDGIAFGEQAGGALCSSSFSGGVASGNFLGLPAASTTISGNGVGVKVVGGTVRVGGPDPIDRNVISANATHGLFLSTAAASNSVVENNLIGTDKTGLLALGNGSVGVVIQLASIANVRVGGPTAPNLIAFNGSHGIDVRTGSASGHRLSHNRIHANGGLGINLLDAGVAANDSNDADTGPNGLQNFPVLATAARVPTGVTIEGMLDVGHPGTLSYFIAMYASSACDPSGHGEGERFLIGATRSLSSTSEGFTLSALTPDPLPTGTVITTTATAPDGSTSEFSECFFLDPPPLVVNTTADPGTGVCDVTECTLREAIDAANARPEGSQSKIEFDIPGDGELLISPINPLPTILRSVLIDGYSQPGTSVNTDPVASNAVLRIRIDGSQMGNALASAFGVCANNVTLRGLSITGFDLVNMRAIRFGKGSSDEPCASPPTGGVLAGNFVGLQTDGTTADGNRAVLVIASVARIGGSDPADRNIIAASRNDAISLAASSSGSSVLGNLIGTDRSGLLDRGNFGAGVTLSNAASSTLIGSDSSPNRIAFNGSGIQAVASAGTGNTFHANHIRNNDALGIDIGTDGVTLNDSNDVDSGPNALQNFPVLHLAQRTAQGLRVQGELDIVTTSVMNKFVVALYASAACDASGHGEGERFLGATEVELGVGDGPHTFAIDLATDDPLPPGAQITSVATGANSQNTSEFSACIAATDPPPGFVVNTTTDTDDGTCDVQHCSLREAINAANAQAGADQISFAIPGGGPFTIEVADFVNLPSITDTVVIDGYTQIGSAPNTSAIGSNAAIEIVLSGSSNSSGLTICADDVVVRGLAFTGWSTPLRVGQSTLGECAQPPSGVRIVGNFFGLLPDGSTTVTTRRVGIFKAVVEVGGTALADRNLFAGGDAGLSIERAESTGTLVRGNVFGTDASGTSDLGAAGPSISLGGGSAGVSGATGITVGDPVAPNVLRFAQVGIDVGDGATGNRLFANEFSDHDEIALNLCPPAACPRVINANDPDDSDLGANNLQNFPVLLGGEAQSGSFTINGLLDVPAAISNAPYTIALYESAACAANGHGEGEIFLGAQSVNLSGISVATESFSVTISAPPPAAGRVITATATDPQGNTSEFSACLAAPVIVTVFADGFED